MLNLRKEYFADTEISGLLAEETEDNVQAVGEFLQTLFSLYERSADGEPVADAFVKDWGIFEDEGVMATVLEEMGNPFLVADKIQYAEEFRCYRKAWDEVKEDVKLNFRFFCHMGTISDVLENYSVDNDTLMLYKGHQFFRARVHHQEEAAFKLNEMGCPPEPWMATPGRANPRGIRYLYLCNDDETPFYEVRPYYLDRVDIGVFRIVEDNVKIVDFTQRVNLFNVYNDEGEALFKDMVKRRVLFDAISQDLSNPIHSYDSELEYVPTQYVCEYFKNIGADGIMFKSSVHESGKNLVLFYPGKAECVEVHPYEVDDLMIGRKELV